MLKMKHFLTTGLFSLILVGSLICLCFNFSSKPALAAPQNFQQAQQNIGLTAGKARLQSSTNPAELAALIIKSLLALVGIIFFILILYGGFLWMTAAGNETKITKAKTLIIQAIIGLLIITSAYVIAAFVSSAIEPTVPPVSSPSP
jgi:hypothetical protein